MGDFAPDERWVCDGCTYANKCRYLKCKICSKKKDSSNSRSNSTIPNGIPNSDSSCVVCRHENHSNTDKSSKCDCNGQVNKGNKDILADLHHTQADITHDDISLKKLPSNTQTDTASSLVSGTKLGHNKHIGIDRLEAAFNFNNNSDERKQVWICKYCTYENSVDLVKCSMCECSRRSPATSTSPNNKRTSSANSGITDDVEIKAADSVEKGNFILPTIPIDTPKKIEKCSVCNQIFDEKKGNCGCNVSCKVARVTSQSIGSHLESLMTPVKNFFKQPMVKIDSLVNGPSTSRKSSEFPGLPTNSNSVDKTSDGDSSNWSCDACTFINTNESLACSVCSTERLTPQTSMSGGWKCQKCTLINRGTSERCRACRTTNVSHSGPSHLPDGFGKSKSTTRLENPHALLPPITDSGSSKLLEKQSDNSEFSQKTQPLARAHKQLRPSKSDASIHTRSSMNDVLTSSLKRDKVDGKFTTNQAVDDEALERWQYITMFCKHNKEPYVDSDFPPSASSLSFDVNKPMTKVPITWLRPNDISLDKGDNPRVKWAVCRTPMASDISQGLLGNCWFLSALTVLTERPELIKRIILTPDLCPEGIYMLRLCLDGNWTVVLIDDLLPCGPDKKLIFSKAHRKQLWVPLIEKALAKLYGCYEALSAGKSIEGLLTLTGEPCDSIQLQGNWSGDEAASEVELVWARLLSSRESGFVMGASCGGGNMAIDDDVYLSQGLHPRHAYAILDVQNIGSHRLLRLRNPWGTNRWSGDWSQDSSKWNDVSQEVRDRLQVHQSLDGWGMFWISLDDILRYFDSIDICKIRSDWNETRVSATFPDSCQEPLHYVLITIFHPTELELSLFQSGHRERESAPVDLCILVNRYAQSVGTLVAVSRRQVRNVVSCSCLLEPGQYVILPVAFNKWITGCKPVKYTLAVHSTKAVMVDQMVAAPQSPMLAEAVIQLTVVKGARYETESQHGVTVYYLKQGWAGLIVVMENRQSHNYAQVKCDCSEKSYNVVSTRGSFTVIDCIPPLHRQVLIVLSQVEGSQGYNISHRLVHRLSPSPGLGDWGTTNGQHEPPISPDVYGLHSPQAL